MAYLVCTVASEMAYSMLIISVIEYCSQGVTYNTLDYPVYFNLFNRRTRTVAPTISGSDVACGRLLLLNVSWTNYLKISDKL